MAERDDDLSRLPGVFELGWLMLMRPESLHQRLRLAGVADPNAKPLALLRKNQTTRTYLKRMVTIFFLIAAVVFLASCWKAYSGVPHAHSFSIPSGLVVGTAVGISFGMAFGIVIGIVFGSAIVIAGPSIGVIFYVGPAAAICYRLACGRTGDHIGSIVAWVVAIVASLVKTVQGLEGESPTGDIVGDFIGFAIVYAVFCYYGYLRVPIWGVEVIIQLFVVARQRWMGKVSLALSPILYDEMIFLPLPFLTWLIFDTGLRDPALASRAIAACEMAPTRRGDGRRALAHLRSAQLIEIADRREFLALIEMRRYWLSKHDEARDLILLAFRETARNLHAAELILLPDQRQQQLNAAKARLHALDNAILAASDSEALAYRPALTHWQRLVDDWLAETTAEAARVLPNPFRAGEPLEPEFGREVFRGREGLVTAIEGILGDPTRAASLALIGPRRCGKTSLLRMLPQKLPDTQVVFFDVQDTPTDRPAAFVAALVRTAQDQARRDRGLTLPGLGVADLADADALTALRDWLERLETAPGLPRFLLCIDEFERLEGLYPDATGGEHRALRQLLGLIRATIQHRRRVRVLVAGAAPFEELDALWNDHFVNLRELAIGHLNRDTVLGLLTRPTAAFPPDCLPPAVAEAIWQRTLGQPYLTQLYGLLVVERLNAAGRRQAAPADVAAVEPLLLDQAGYYLRHLVQSAPAAARAVLEQLAGGGLVDPASLDGPTRRWLQRRWLITEAGGLGIPVLGAFLRGLA